MSKLGMQTKIIRITTIPLSLDKLLEGQLSYLSDHYEIVGVSSYGDGLLTKIGEREGVRTKAIEMQRSISPIKDLMALWQLYKLFKKEKPSIVHSITPKAGLLSMMAAKFAGVPIRMHTFTGLIFPGKTGLFQKLLILMDRVLCRCATNIYPEGQGVKNDLINFKITSKPLKIIANGNVNGVDMARFNPAEVSGAQKAALRKQLGINPNDFVFIFVGRLVGDKGINELIKAYAGLCGNSEGNSITHNSSQTTHHTSHTTHSSSLITHNLLLVGPQEPDLDPLTPETQKEIDQNPNIIAVGYQADVRQYYAISDALVFPSYREGFPNVVLEAGAMGLPAIVTNINGCNEIIEEGENGTIIPAKGTTLPTGQAGTSTQEMQVALLNAMQLFMQDKNYYLNLKENARPMISSRYEQIVVWEAILEEYKLLLKK